MDCSAEYVEDYELTSEQFLNKKNGTRPWKKTANNVQRKPQNQHRQQQPVPNIQESKPVRRKSSSTSVSSSSSSEDDNEETSISTLIQRFNRMVGERARLLEVDTLGRKSFRDGLNLFTPGKSTEKCKKRKKEELKDEKYDVITKANNTSNETKNLSENCKDVDISSENCNDVDSNEKKIMVDTISCLKENTDDIVELDCAITKEVVIAEEVRPLKSVTDGSSITEKSCEQINQLETIPIDIECQELQNVPIKLVQPVDSGQGVDESDDDHIPLVLSEKASAISHLSMLKLIEPENDSFLKEIRLKQRIYRNTFLKNKRIEKKIKDGKISFEKIICENKFEFYSKLQCEEVNLRNMLNTRVQEVEKLRKDFKNYEQSNRKNEKDITLIQQEFKKHKAIIKSSLTATTLKVRKLIDLKTAEKNDCERKLNQRYHLGKSELRRRLENVNREFSQLDDLCSNIYKELDYIDRFTIQ